MWFGFEVGLGWLLAEAALVLVVGVPILVIIAYRETRRLKRWPGRG